MRRLLCATLLLVISFAGCVGDEKAPPPPVETSAAPPPGPRVATSAPPVWAPQIILDDMRAGGEPVIAITPKGTILVASHPGYTHVHPDPSAVPPTGGEAVIPTQGQSYMWRSTDGGKTWIHISLLPVEAPNSGPRGVGQGVSDPEFTIDANGRIWFTDLEALAEASVSWSDDDGATWVMGNNAASGGPVDRQWLASFGDTMYFTANYFGDHRILATRDGLTYERRGDVPCSGDLVAHPVTGVLYAGCGAGITVSSDGGQTWSDVLGSGVDTGGHGMTEPALDAAGHVYMATDPGYEDVVLLRTDDEGETWWNLSMKQYFPELANGTLVWPWVSAGSEGRVSVSFYASAATKAVEKADAEWYLYNVIVMDAQTQSPTIYPSKASPLPFHRGAICQGGTGCQATTAVDEGSDRRLGDFFESTIDADGFVHIVYSNTFENPTHTVSHVGYVRMTDGPRLVEGELPKGFPTQG